MRKGEIWLIDLPDGQGYEQKGQRPAVVLGGANSLFTAIPLTTNLKRAAFSFTLFIEPTKENGLSDDSVALVYQLKALDKSRFKHKIGELGRGEIKAIDSLVVDLLELPKVEK